VRHAASPILNKQTPIERRLPLTEIPIQENREDRYGKTERKNLTLTAETIEAVQAYADRHGLYFSVAIEALALMGLEHTTAESLPRLVANLLERAFNRQFNRFAKLLSYAAISAEETNAKADFLILQLFRREAHMDPEHFIDTMVVSTDPNKQPDAQVRVVKASLCAEIHQDAVARLRKPLREIVSLLNLEVADGAHNV
jgi:hypothetical protein